MTRENDEDGARQQQEGERGGVRRVGAWGGGEAAEVLPGWSPIQSSLMNALFLFTIFIFVLPAWRCPCPSPFRGGLCQQVELREEGGEQAIWEEEH